MKKFIVEYTVDFGETYHKEIVEAENFSNAYVRVDLKLPKHGAITGIFEII
jgi:hypothetical protein